jgi:CDP-diacylglycerol--serine O-phosphatidyltransferase
MLFDFFDGKVARWKGESSILGQELDSLADLISFGVAPAALAFVIGLRSLLDILTLSLFVCCGLARLARFNVTTHLIPKDEKGKSTHFEGLPIPSSLILVALMWAWFEMGLLDDGIPGGEFSIRGYSAHTFTLLWATWAVCMVSKTLKVPKL